MKSALWWIGFGLYAAFVHPLILLALTLRDIRRGRRHTLVITNEETEEAREIVYRFRWVAEVRSWFVAFPNWELAKVTRVEIRG